MSWGEGRLFNLSEIVVWIPVEDEFSNRDEWVVSMRPYLCDIEDVPFIFVSIFFRHDLDVHGPGGCVSLGDLVEQISGGVVGVNSFQLVSLVCR